MDLLERTALDAPRHPWEVVRSRFFITLLERCGALDDASTWLDVGAGDGWLGEALYASLPQPSKVICWDINYTADETEPTSARPVTKTAVRPNRPFDGALLLDVIEHVEDDVELLSGVVSDLVKPGGWVLVSVPAYQGLFSGHDRYLGHYRRYSPDQCRRVVTDSGLQIEQSGGLFHSLLAARWAARAKEWARPKSEPFRGVGAWNAGPGLTAVVTSTLLTDSKLTLALARAGKSLPGLSCWVLARRPS